jgi:hypothetical protein
MKQFDIHLYHVTLLITLSIIYNDKLYFDKYRFVSLIPQNFKFVGILTQMYSLNNLIDS